MFRNLPFFLLLCSTLVSSVSAAGDARELIDTGNRLWSEGRTTEAEASFKQAIALDPGSAKAYSRLGSLYLVGNRGDEAIAAYQEAIMRDASDPRLFVAIGIAYLHQGHYGMARDMADQALRLDPGLAGALKMKEYTQAKQAALAAAGPQGRSPAAPRPGGHP